MIIVDTGRIFEIIGQRRPASVSLNGPDGMLPQVQDAAVAITERFGIPAYVIADTTWGTCDLNSRGAAALGADHAVDHRRDDWHKEVRRIASGMPKQYGEPAGVDVIFEHIGGSHWRKELGLLNYGGTIVTTGATTGYNAPTDLRHIFFKGINILGSTQGTRAELEQGLYWMSRGRIRSVIDSVFGLDDAVSAHNRMLSGRGLFGKILIKPGMA